MRIVVGLAALAVLACLAAPRSGAALSADACAKVTGGCTVTAFGDCAHATNTDIKACHNCVGTFDCSSTHNDEGCTPLTNTSAEDCIACGTCNEACTGVSRNWTGGDDGTGCDGTYTSSGACTRSWKDAQNGDCDVACGSS